MMSSTPRVDQLPKTPPRTPSQSRLGRRSPGLSSDGPMSCRSFGSSETMKPMLYKPMGASSPATRAKVSKEEQLQKSPPRTPLRSRSRLGCQSMGMASVEKQTGPLSCRSLRSTEQVTKTLPYTVGTSSSFDRALAAKANTTNEEQLPKTTPRTPSRSRLGRRPLGPPMPCRSLGSTEKTKPGAKASEGEQLQQLQKNPPRTPSRSRLARQPLGPPLPCRLFGSTEKSKPRADTSKRDELQQMPKSTPQTPSQFRLGPPMSCRSLGSTERVKSMPSMAASSPPNRLSAAKAKSLKENQSQMSPPQSPPRTPPRYGRGRRLVGRTTNEKNGGPLTSVSFNSPSNCTTATKAASAPIPSFQGSNNNTTLRSLTLNSPCNRPSSSSSAAKARTADNMTPATPGTMLLRSAQSFRTQKSTPKAENKMGLHHKKMVHIPCYSFDIIPETLDLNPAALYDTASTLGLMFFASSEEQDFGDEVSVAASVLSTSSITSALTMATGAKSVAKSRNGANSNNREGHSKDSNHVPPEWKRRQPSMRYGRAIDNLGDLDLQRGVESGALQEKQAHLDDASNALTASTDLLSQLSSCMTQSNNGMKQDDIVCLLSDVISLISSEDGSNEAQSKRDIRQELDRLKKLNIENPANGDNEAVGPASSRRSVAEARKIVSSARALHSVAPKATTPSSKAAFRGRPLPRARPRVTSTLESGNTKANYVGATEASKLVSKKSTTLSSAKNLSTPKRPPLQVLARTFAASKRCAAGELPIQAHPLPKQEILSSHTYSLPQQEAQPSNDVKNDSNTAALKRAERRKKRSSSRSRPAHSTPSSSSQALTSYSTSINNTTVAPLLLKSVQRRRSSSMSQH